MSRTKEEISVREHRTVSFPELVRLRFVWRRTVMADPEAIDDAKGSAYYEARRDFEHHNGRIVNAYWCSELEAAVALTEKRHSGPFKWFRTPIRRFHRVSDYATRGEPEIARLLQQCDELAIRAVAVLGGRNQRICTQLVMASSGHLLSLVDRPPLPETTIRESLESEHHDFSGAQAYYRQAANSEAQMTYFAGMAIGLGLLGCFYLLVGESLEIAGVNEANIVGCLTAGAIGALVSVIARINSGSFALDFDIAPTYTLFLGGLRPWIGSIFGLAMYFAITSGFLNLFEVPGDPEQRFYFLCVIAFLAGFSERWAQDTLTGSLSGDKGATASGPPAAAAEDPVPAEKSTAGK